MLSTLPADVYARGYEVFGKRNAFQQWMQEPVVAMGGQVPRQLLSSTYGIQHLLMELGKIEHGIFA